MVPHKAKFTPLFIFSGVVAAIVLLLVESPTVQARVLNSRLESVIEAPSSQENLSEAVKVISLAKQAHVTLLPNLVAKAINKIGQSETGISTVSGAGSPAEKKDWSVFLAEANRELLGTSIVFVDVSSSIDLSSSTQSLAGFSFKNSGWENGILSYQGGHIELDGMTFKNVIIAVSNNEDARKFVNAVVAFRGKEVIINIP